MITITEALAEIKTIDKRLDKKRDFIRTYIARPDNIKDPHIKDGGTPALLAGEQQAIHDLEERIVTLRRGIQKANEATVITVQGKARSIADWLVWRRDAAPKHQSYLANLNNALNQVRAEAQRKGVALVANGTEAQKPNDIIVNINEKQLAIDIETMEIVLGELDGMLSLKNATVLIG
jgi:hypothetical protein